MAVASGEATLKPVDDAQAALMPELGMMLRAFWVSPIRMNFVALAFAIVIVIALTAYGQIKLNEWNQPFYDALARKDWQEFVHQLFRFAQIAIALLVMNVAQVWLNQSIKIKLRQGLVDDLIEQWLKPGRAFRLSTRPIGINPDQRMHEDARHLTELSADLGIGLLQASVLLSSFVSVLWALSSGFVFHLGTATLAVPGYLVWAAVFYAGTASLLSYLVGRPLVGLNAERYSREADLRYGLMRVSEHIDAITLANGEPDERRRITIDLAKVLAAMRNLAWGQTRLTWITAGYGWTALVVPIGVAVPAYFSGSLSLGGLMVTVGAFNQVQSSLRWFVDNFSVIADWRATLLRVSNFRRAAAQDDTEGDGADQIQWAEGEPGHYRLDRLCVFVPGGSTRLREESTTVEAGEKVAIIGERRSGKTLLFRALAGLWSWGSGSIVRPKGEAIMYMPRTPYLPPGNLRDALAYPAPAQSFETRSYETALDRVGLKGLATALDEPGRWDRQLNEDEQQALAFARLILHKPAWIVMDEVLDSVTGETHRRFLQILHEDLKRSGVIHIGRSEGHDHLFARVLHLVPARRASERAGERHSVRA
ncbi:glycosyl transferase family 1 [Labrys okinawensis]|uniref:Glycosyl transferase family 1 n=1 Tax=Labrys okinawensis TaxID=346911 RepID=A0A2S9Q635_9HYPH|nr:ABC transporter ATP-binding protein/permease [Labrys okinawensis]PRH84811.1 glycosyl transferase family 1 [Labrys okinawensis]